MAAQQNRVEPASPARPERLDFERQIVAVRAGGVLFGVGCALYGTGESTLVAWTLPAVLAIGTFITWLVVRRDPTEAGISAVGVFGFAIDALVVSVAVFNTMVDPGLDGYLMLLIPLFEAAVRWGVRGAVVASVFSTGALIWFSVLVASRADEVVTVDHVALRVFVTSILAIFMGLTVDKLDVATRTVRRTLDATQDIIVTAELGTGKMISISSAVQRILGYDPANLEGRSAIEFFNIDDVSKALPDGLSEDGIERLELRAYQADGSEVWLEISVTVALEEDRWYGVARDTTERRRLQDALAHQAFHDGLTGLPNRSKLHQQLTDLLANDDRPALLYIDLDGFKPVNDRLGHRRGDELLTEVGERLQAIVRDVDLVARIGGDEFCVLLVGPAPEAMVESVVGRVQRSLAQPFYLGDDEATISASVGVAYAAPGDDGDSMLNRADAEMYSLKPGHIEQQSAVAMHGADRRRTTPARADSPQRS